MTFELHPNFSSKLFIKEFPLSLVFLEDNYYYPWLILVPKRSGCSKLMDLAMIDQIQLIKELDTVQNFLWKEFKPKQLNVAALGNKTPQLHIHVIARFETDPAWPSTVWDYKDSKSYTETQKYNMVDRCLKNLLSPF